MTHHLKPQTVIFEKGYDPQRSEGAAVPPVFRTSTFIFKPPRGKRAFEIAYGLAPRRSRARARRSSTPGSTTPTARSSRTRSWPGTAPRRPRSSPRAWAPSPAPAWPSCGPATRWSSPTRSTAAPSTSSATCCPTFHIRTMPFPAGADRGGDGRAGAARPDGQGHLPRVAGQPDHDALRHRRRAADGRPALAPGRPHPGHGGQHLHGPHLLQAHEPRRRRRPLLGHQVLRRPLGPRGRPRHGQQGADRPDQGHAHHPRLQLRPRHRLAHPPLPGDPADPHGEAAGERPQGRGVPARPPEGQGVAYPVAEMGERPGRRCSGASAPARAASSPSSSRAARPRPSRCSTPSTT